MLEQWLVWERDLFFALNGSDFEWLDRVMWIYTGKMVWLPLAALILFLLFYKRDWREAVLVLLMIALVVTLCDQFASHVCKPLFTRFRPTHHPDFADQVKTVFGYRGGKYGFISSHAANAFGFAMFMSLLFRDRLFSCLIILWAVVVSYSRIYLGVHFITDILPGALSGVVFGLLVYYFYGWIRQRWLHRRDLPYSHERSRWISWGIGITLVGVILLNPILISFLK